MNFLAHHCVATELEMQIMAARIGFAKPDILFPLVRRVAETRIEPSDVIVLHLDAESPDEATYAQHALEYLNEKFPRQYVTVCVEQPFSDRILGTLVDVAGSAPVSFVTGGISPRLVETLTVRRLQTQRIQRRALTKVA